MKKVISIFLSVILVLSAVFVMPCFVSAAQGGTESDEAVGVLKAIQVIPDEIDLDAEITRADFAVYMARVFRINDFDVSDTRYYADVPMDHYALTAINYLTERGIVSGDSDRLFRPDDKISVAEMCKILLVSFGCENYALSLGGYPTGYLAAARRLNVLWGSLDVSANVTVSDAARLIFNTVRDEFAEKIFFERDRGENLLGMSALNEYFDVYVKEGTVTSAAGSSIYQDKFGDEKAVYIDDTKLDDSNGIVSESLLGSKVRAYYKSGKSSGKDELIFIYDDTAESDVFEISIDDFIKLSGSSIEYDSLGKTKRYSFGKVVSVVYNGSPYQGSMNDAFDDLCMGTITMKKLSGGNTYVVIIQNGTPFYVSYINAKDGEITDSCLSTDDNGTNNGINLDDYEICEIFDVNNKPMTINDIKQKDIITLYESSDKRRARLVVSDKTVSGAITSVYDDGGRKVIEIGNAAYTLGKLCEKKSKADLSPNSNVVVYIDSLGEAAYIESLVPGEMKPGWLVGVATDSDAFNKTAMFRLYSSAGKIENLNAADEVKIDGEKYDNADDMIAAIPNNSAVGGNVKPQLIMYSTDSDNKIKKIDTINVGTNENPDETLAKNISNGDILVYADGRLGLKSVLASTAIQFTVAADKDALNASDKKFAIGAPTLVERGYYDTVETYKFRGDSVYDDVIVRNSGTGEINDESYIILVSSVTACLGDDETRTYKISGLQLGAPVSYTVDSDYNMGDVAEGDIIRVGLVSGNVTNIEMIYDYSVGGYPTWRGVDDERNWYVTNSSKYYWDKQQIIYGYVVNKKENIVEISYKNDDRINEVCNHLENVMIYDASARNHTYVGTISDIRDRSTYGNECSRIVFQTYQGSFKGVIVYR